MSFSVSQEGTFPVDILQLIFDNLVGDTDTLACVGLVCRSWRALCLRSLFREVDLSSHNNGRLPELEDRSSLPLVRGVVMSDDSDQYRPRNLVARQRAFLRLITERPELATHVRIFKWTLVWMDFDDEDLQEIDLRTWDVFGRLQNVNQLDLASLHDISGKPYIRQNPASLFPAVTHLKLVGWMHRGLVKAIVNSLDASKLVRLELSRLQDEGALPSGRPFPADLATYYYHDRGDPYNDPGIDDGLFKRQERGETGILPGPMWYPLRFLRQSRMSSIAQLHIRLGPLGGIPDERNAIQMFEETSEFIRSAKDTLRTISIEVGESPVLFAQKGELTGMCGTAIIRSRSVGLPLCFDLTSAFLHRIIPVLTKETFPHLEEVNLKGFRVVRDGKSRLRRAPSPDLTWQYIRACPFVDEEFTKTANLDFCEPFLGYDYYLPAEDQLKFEDELGRLMN